MSQQKKQKVNITNREIYSRLNRLGWTELPSDIFLAYLGLQLVNKGSVIDIDRAMKIIHDTHLDEKMHSTAIPCENIVEGLIYMTVYKRELISRFLDNPEFEVWEDELTGPLFDILKDLSEVYKL